jgi:hypothetical protein
MLTGLGGVIVAVTGLITALYSTGVIGSKGSSSSTPHTVTAANAPATAAAPVITESTGYKALAGKWSVAECPSQYFDKVECVTWEYDAAVSGNKLTLTGRVIALDEDKNIPPEAERLKATYTTTLNDTVGVGEYKLKRPDGSTVTTDATIQLKEDLSAFIGKFDEGGEPISLIGRKLLQQ